MIKNSIRLLSLIEKSTFHKLFLLRISSEVNNVFVFFSTERSTAFLQKVLKTRARVNVIVLQILHRKTLKLK